MKKLGISNIYSYSLRFICGFLIAFLATLLPNDYFSASLSNTTFTKTTYDSLSALLIGSSSSAMILSIKIIALITTLIFIMDFVKSREFIKQSGKNVSKGFSLLVGIFLGITYGAGILIQEAKWHYQ